MKKQTKAHKVKCHHCGHITITKSILIKIGCGSCGIRTPNKKIKERQIGEKND